jgi:sugar O-acyltransferase (sialic acid O-acetyltransferase NeuD family)
MSKPVIVMGGGGHALMVVDVLRQLEIEILAIVSRDSLKKCAVFDGIKTLHEDNVMLDFSSTEICLVNGIGSVPGSRVRATLFDYYKKDNFEFLSVISPSSVISAHAHISEGAQVLHGAIVNAGATIGDNSIINSGAIVEHECSVGKNNHIAPGASLCGSVTTGDFVHIGTGANVIQGVKIGDNSTVGAGATLTRDLHSNASIYVARPFCIDGITQ